MLGKKAKNTSTINLNLIIVRLLSLGEITFNQIYFMLFGELPQSLGEVVDNLAHAKTTEMIDESNYYALIKAYEKEFTVPNSPSNYSQNITMGREVLQ